jgi:UPF0755 protein
LTFFRRRSFFKDTWMLRKRDKTILVAAALIFLITQTIIFANIPKDRDSTAVSLVVKSGTGVRAIASQLKEEGLIHSSYLFLLASLAYGGKLIAGEYTLRPDMSTLDIVRKMGRGERNIYALKILEGHNIYNVAESMEKAGIMPAAEFLRFATDRQSSRKISIQGDSLEGYLFPDTYFYSKEIEVEKFLEKIVQRTLKLFATEETRKSMTELGLDIHGTLTLASMIEREAKVKAEKPVISAVFHNRLKKGMSLDSDPTVIYGTGQFGSPIRKSHLTTHTPYNTYTFRGLPKGPISNPNEDSIMAALHPAPVDYLYFVSKNDGTHVFTKDMKDHNRFVAMYQRVKNTKHN